MIISMKVGGRMIRKQQLETEKEYIPLFQPKGRLQSMQYHRKNACYRFNGTETASFISNSKFWQKEFYLSNLGLLMTPDHSDIVT